MLVVLILKERPSNQLILNLSKNTQAPSNLKFRLAGSGGDSRTGVQCPMLWTKKVVRGCEIRLRSDPRPSSFMKKTYDGIAFTNRERGPTGWSKSPTDSTDPSAWLT